MVLTDETAGLYSTLILYSYFGSNMHIGCAKLTKSKSVSISKSGTGVMEHTSTVHISLEQLSLLFCKVKVYVIVGWVSIMYYVMMINTINDKLVNDQIYKILKFNQPPSFSPYLTLPFHLRAMKPLNVVK